MSMYKGMLLERFESKKAGIGVVGLGYVGLPLLLLPLLLRYCGVGFRVRGIDIDGSKVEKLNAGESYIEHIDGAKFESAVRGL